MTTPILLLDVMDTLVVDPFFEAVPAFFGLTLEELLAAKHPTAWIDFELGRCAAETYYSTMFVDSRRFDHRAFERHVRDAYQWVEGMPDLLARLAAVGVEMHALSNYPVWYRLIEEALEVSRFVKWSFVSCRTGVRKPDPGAYVGAAGALCRAMDQCLVIDDRESNCAAARAAGMPALVFASAPALERDLVARGVLPARS
jgi:FMN hydrolase / 5-amino-6-(5-phospho-D-ribitylamino)uracil phosphatase